MPQRLGLRLTLPGSKSITNRALLCAALAAGKSRVYGALDSVDTRVMLRALRRLGIGIVARKDFIEITGRGGVFPRGRLTLNLENAGTAVRFLSAVMAQRVGVTVVTGNARMRQRPLRDLADGLRQLGVTVAYIGQPGCPPLKITGGVPVAATRTGYTVSLKGDVSSQYLSALLMLGPLLSAPLRITVSGTLSSRLYVAMTIAVMKSFGVLVTRNGFRAFSVRPQAYCPCRYLVEGDASAATYFSSLQFLHGGRLGFTNLNCNKSIQGDAAYAGVLGRLGQGSIDMNAMPDAAMTLAVTAAFVPGKTVISGIGNLRVKESDRLAALHAELSKCGVRTAVTKNSIAVTGGISGLTVPPPAKPVATYRDHRMAMCFAVLGTLRPGVSVADPGCVDKTYPAFWRDLEKAYLLPLKLGRKNLVLTGMRGSGKSHLGRRLATHLKRPFVDLDAEIESAAGMNTAEIVKQHGWTYFRNLEQKICSKFSDSQGLVIATGGGVVLNEMNMKALKKNGVVVFVFADPSALVARLKKKNDRPALIGGDPIAEIPRVWKERRPLYYHYADVVWDNTSGEVIKANFSSLER